MKPSNQPEPGASDAKRPQADSKPPTTPNADMQAEDAGTADSENDSATQAGRAMKQTSKTEADGGKQR